MSAIITAYRRLDQTLFTLQKLADCQPPPSEILVHVDGNATDVAVAIQNAFPDVQVIASKENIGPGGGRNKLISGAKYEFVASFDDDSYPIDPDYFSRVERLMSQFPGASILTADVSHRNETASSDAGPSRWISDFVGCACVYRRSTFLATSGYVVLPIAYGMEEVDLALRLHSQGGKILSTTALRIFHDTELEHHATGKVTAASVANLALLSYLRYPRSLWPMGAAQICNRLLWLMRHRRFAGISSGLLGIPKHIWRYRRFRDPVSSRAVRSYLHLRRNPQLIAREAC